MKVKLDTVDLGANPRKDYNLKAMASLIESVKQHGVLEAITVVFKDGRYEVVRGSRRYKAAKAAGVEWILVNVVDKEGYDDTFTKQLVENLHREDLNPVEEGEAFKDYIIAAKATTKGVAQRINKPEFYVKRRLEILNATPETQKALRDGKIKLGHALALVRVPNKKEQNEILRDAIKGKYNVSDVIDDIKHIAYYLNRAVFDLAQCKGCQYNGGEQTVLFETGSELKNNCTNSKCFKETTNKFFQARRNEYEVAGVEIVDKEDKRANYMNRESYYDKETQEKLLKSILKHPKAYVIVFENDHAGVLEERVYSIKKAESNRGSPIDGKARLKNKISEHKRQFLIRTLKGYVGQSTKVCKAVSLFYMIKEADNFDQEEIFKKLKIKTSGYCYDYSEIFKKLLAAKESDLDNMIDIENRLRVKRFGDDELELLSSAVKLKLNKHFKVSEAYLNLYTIADLPKIAKELGVDIKKGKKTDMVKQILKANLKGKVPKAVDKKIRGYSRSY